MGLRIFTACVVLMAGYMAFGDWLYAHAFATPETFVSSVGRGIGSAISSVASSLGGMIWG